MKPCGPIPWLIENEGSHREGEGNANKILKISFVFCQMLSRVSCMEEAA
jgi:hypothetical protein